MSLIRGVGHSFGAELGIAVGAASVEAQERRAVASARLCAGTLACPHCDVPVTTGGQPRALTDQLACPFCDHRAAVREFLSLAVPSRPTRVVVSVSRPFIASGCARRA